MVRNLGLQMHPTASGVLLPATSMDAGLRSLVGAQTHLILLEILAILPYKILMLHRLVTNV